jgi:glutathionylspermidine synthase
MDVSLGVLLIDCASTMLASANLDHAQISRSSWLVDGESAGMGIRESKGLITNNTSSFVPHLFR